MTLISLLSKMMFNIFVEGFGYGTVTYKSWGTSRADRECFQ